MSKKVIAYILILAVIMSSFVLAWADVQDYRDIVFKDSDTDTVLKPTAQFSVAHKDKVYMSPTGIDLNSNSMVVNAAVGDTVTVADLRRSNRGKTLKAWDFQYTRPDGKNQFITTQAFQKSYTLDVVGIYTFSLCVRDTIENEAWTSYWGNWSDNGNHRVIGNNPGRDANDPADDFNGYWYFTRIVVKVVNNPPTADFTIGYKGENITEPGIPESFKVLLKELQSLALDVTVLDENGEEVKMTESIDYGDSDLTPLIEGDNNFRYDEGYEDVGFTQTNAEDIDSEIFDIYEEEPEDILDEDVYEEEEEEPAENLCPNCGEVVPPGSKRCKSCGQSLTK
jgi:hypothetical protein